VAVIPARGDGKRIPLSRPPASVIRFSALFAELRVAQCRCSILNIGLQDLEEAFHDASQFYWGRPEAWESSQPVFFILSGEGRTLTRKKTGNGPN
jgi:N-acylneuraminate cytidylyltransferase